MEQLSWEENIIYILFDKPKKKNIYFCFCFSDLKYIF